MAILAQYDPISPVLLRLSLIQRVGITILMMGMVWIGDAKSGEPASPAGSLLVASFDAKDLGRETMSWCTTQDKDGVLYFGGDQLLVADGERWKSYPMGASYAVRSLEFGPDGRLWAAGANELGWFERTVAGDWNYHSLLSQLPDGTTHLGDVWNVYPTASGAVYVSDSKVMVWDGEHLKQWSYEVIRRLLSTRYEGSVYVYHWPTGLLKITSAGPELAIPSDIIGSFEVFWMGTIHGETVFATSGGVGRIENNKLTFSDATLSAFVRTNILTSVQRLTDGTLALGTLRGGIALVGSDLKLDRILSTKDHLPTDEIYGLFVSRDGALWATSRSQITRIDARPQVAVFGSDHGLPSTGCVDLIIDQGNPTILSDDGLRQLQTGPDGRRIFQKIDSIHGITRDLEPGPDGPMVATTYGIYGFHSGNATPLYKTPDDVFKIQATPIKGVFNASAGRRIVEFSTDGSHSRELTNPLPDVAENFAQDYAGRLWIGTGSKGLLVARPIPGAPVDAESASLHHGFPVIEGHVQVAQFADTIVGIGPGAACWLNPATDQFEPILNFPSGIPTAISQEDSEGRIWITLEHLHAGMPARAGQLIRTETSVVWQPRSIPGLATAGVPRALLLQKTDNGDILWVAGNRALLRVTRPGQLVAVPPAKPLLHAVVRGEPGAADQPIVGALPYSTRRIALEFSSTDYGLRDTLRYQTLLQGVDLDWSTPTNTPSLELANLREGDYTFMVRMMADTGLTSPAATLQFSIATPWWRTPFAYAGYAAALALAITGLYHLRIRTVRRRAKILEATVLQRTDELEKANAAKTEFVASMSHEIRNPMNGIIGSTHALADTPLNDEQRELVATLRNCATFLSSLVEDVLDFSSIEAGAFTVQQLPCNPAEILEATAAMLSAPAAEAGAHFDIDVDRTLPARFLGDPARIQQIIVNYATNALKFSGGGRVRLSTYSDNGNITFAVTDDGPGISTEEQSVLFTRFSRLKTARNAGITGTGLGLAVCRAVAERMNGSVGVASAPRRGATFFLRLPLVKPSESERVVRPAMPMLEGARALVVEDLDYNSRALAAMLRKMGFSVDIATHGAEALRQLATQSYHAVFLDYDLPDMSGLEIVRRMRLHKPHHGKTLVIATTAYSTVQDREACLAAGMDIFLSKPITPEKLHTALAGLSVTPLPSQPVQLPITSKSGVNLRMLAYLAGDTPGALQREIGRFLEALVASQTEVTDALRIRERPVLGKAAHRLISHARMIEALALANLAEEMEIEADYADENRLDQLGAQLNREVDNLRKTLDRHRVALTSV